MTSNPSGSPLDESVLARLADHAERADETTDWPAASWEALREVGVTAWGIPEEFGGNDLDLLALLDGYERLAGACLTTAFLLSQRDAAVRRLRSFGSPALLARLLPDLASGRAFITVGLSQLTTSRQHTSPALLATPHGPPDEATGFRLDGVIPWVSGADRAEHVVIGAPIPDGRQALFVLPRSTPGVTVEPPMPLAALRGSRTTQMHCAGVELGREWLLAGPFEKPPTTGRGGAGGFETSCLALGLAGAAIDLLRGEGEVRPDLTEAAERFEAARGRLRSRLREAAEGSAEPAEQVALRVDCTQLALQATQVALTAAKGTGFVAPHPAQRWARQALFFLVWSCPRPAAEGIIGRLLPETGA